MTRLRATQSPPTETHVGSRINPVEPDSDHVPHATSPCATWAEPSHVRGQLGERRGHHPEPHDVRKAQIKSLRLYIITATGPQACGKFWISRRSRSDTNPKDLVDDLTEAVFPSGCGFRGPFIGQSLHVWRGGPHPCWGEDRPAVALPAVGLRPWGIRSRTRGSRCLAA